MSKVVFNKSKTYLIPLMSEFVLFKEELLSNIVNTYLKSDDNEGENYIHILIEFDFTDKNFARYEENLMDNDLFVRMKDIGKYVLYTFKFPEEYIGEYNNFLKSKYSSFDVDAKEMILSFWGGVYSGNTSAIPVLLKIKQILYRDTKLRKEIEDKIGVSIDEKAELGECLDIELETFKETDWRRTNEKKLL